MVISVRLSETDGILFKKYAQANNMTVSEFMRNAALEKIKESYDRDIFGIDTERKKVLRDE